jgi:glutamate-1-semialdehyde 2,1-aminomutase
MFTVFFGIDQVSDLKTAMGADTRQHARYFNHMLKAGVYLPPSQFEACFLSTAHKQGDLNRTLHAVATFK